MRWRPNSGSVLERDAALAGALKSSMTGGPLI